MSAIVSLADARERAAARRATAATEAPILPLAQMSACGLGDDLELLAESLGAGNAEAALAAVADAQRKLEAVAFWIAAPLGARRAVLRARIATSRHRWLLGDE
jgi:hypothetical protein